MLTSVLRRAIHRNSGIWTAAAGGGGFSLVASVAAAGTSGGVTSGNIDTTGANLLVACVAYYQNLGSFSDNKSNTWTAGNVNGFGGDIISQLFYCSPSSVGSGHNFSYSGGGTYPCLHVYAFSGAHASPFVEQQGNNSASATSISAGSSSITPPQDGCLLVTGMCNGQTGGLTYGVDSGYNLHATQQQYSSGVHVGEAAAYLIQGTAAAVNPTWDSGATSTKWGTSHFCFKPA